MTTTERAYPVGLTFNELRQRAWIEGDRRTEALLRVCDAVDDPDADGMRHGGPSIRHVLAVRGQLPLKLETT